MRGTYCLLILLPCASKIRVGALGTHGFPPGLYVYVGSALGGIERRVARHAKKGKKLHWHIDYLLRRGRIVSTIAVPSERRATECAVASALAAADGAKCVLPGFGSSDCRCMSHLLYFGDMDPDWVAETVAMRIAMLDTAYPRRSPSKA